MHRKHGKSSEYPEVNSTNFPSDIASMLNKYKIEKGTSEPAMYSAAMDEYVKLFSYQKIIEEYMNKQSPYRGLLLYYGLGSGKSLTAINIAEQSGRDIVVLLPKSLKQNFIEEIIKYVPRFHRPKDYSTLSLNEQRKIKKKLEAEISKTYSFISSNASTTAQKLSEVYDPGVENDEALGSFLKNVNSLDNKFLIIDEIHNLLVNMINAETKNGTRIYEMIMDAKNLRMLFLSGSPVVGDPFELALLFNMLRGYITVPKSKEKYTVFPDYREFNEFFVDRINNKMINQSLFKERIVGTVSFYGGVKETKGSRNILPYRHQPIVERVQMSEYQWKKYLSARLKEIDEERKAKFSKQKFVKSTMKKPGRSNVSSFRVKSRIVSNFALPPGIERPEFKQKEKASVYDAEYKKMLKEIPEEDMRGDNLKKYSAKMDLMLKKINKLSGNAFVYSQFISLEGIGIFSRVLESNGYTNYNKDHKSSKELGKTFVMFSGSTEDKFRNDTLELFNSPENKHGELIRVILATATMAEGVSLQNIRHIHIMEPYWNLSRLQQIIGRGIRIGSHKNLPVEEREVESFIYLSTAPRDVNMMKVIQEKYTTDESIFINSKRKQELIDQFLKAMKEAAIDCEANYEHNKDEIDECMICIPNDKPMYIPKIEEHMLPVNRNCKGKTSKILTDALKTVTIDGKKYKKDKVGNILEEIKGKKNMFKIRKDLALKSKSKKEK